MKKVLFYPDLKGVSQEETRDLLRKHVGSEYEPTWRYDEGAENIKIWVNPEHHLDVTVLNSLKSLDMLSLAFTGYDKIDLQDCGKRGLKVYYVPDYSGDSVAELAIGLTLSVFRKIPQSHKNLRKGGWDKGVYPGIELRGKKVAILGAGKIGERSARLFEAFGCEVVRWARAEKQSRGMEYLREIFSGSDVIVLHLPVSDETRHMVGEELLRLMKPTAILVNTARSELVDTDALVAALSANRILGAGIDVFDEEARLEKRDLGANPYQDLKNVVTTPHIGFKTTEALHRLAEVAIKNINNFLAGSKENLLE